MFECHVSEHNGLKWLHLNGRIDGLSCPEIQLQVDRLILGSERKIIVSFQDVNYVSSAGLRVFLAAQKQLAKAGGEVILFGLKPDVARVFELSGLIQLFHTASTDEELGRVLRPEPPSLRSVRRELAGLSVQVVETQAEKGELLTFGSQEKLARAEYGPDDVVAVDPRRVQFGTGLAAVGDDYQDYRNAFGEAVIINRNLFFYPAVRRTAVDFMIYAPDSNLEYKFLHGFGFSGDYRYLLAFETREEPTDLARLTEAFLALSGAATLGVVLLAESQGLWGMNLKRIPILENRPSDGREIVAPEIFSEWMNFPVEPSDSGSVVVGAGIVLRDRGRAEAMKLVPREQSFHLHACVLDKGLFNESPLELENETRRVLAEQGPRRVQHLMAQSRFAHGLAGIIELPD